MKTRIVFSEKDADGNVCHDVYDGRGVCVARGVPDGLLGSVMDGATYYAPDPPILPLWAAIVGGLGGWQKVILFVFIVTAIRGCVS